MGKDAKARMAYVQRETYPAQRSAFKIVIELPGLPKTTNGSHGSRFAAAAERKKWRTAVAMIAKFRRPPKPLEKVRLILTRFSSVRTDFDNRVISFKSCVDGLKDARVIKDDTDDVIIDRKYPWERAPPGKGFIRIVVEEILISADSSDVPDSPA